MSIERVCADLGYSYRHNDVDEGARRVLEVIDGHDARCNQYREEQRSLIRRFLPDDATLVHAYARLLGEVVEKPIR